MRNYKNLSDHDFELLVADLLRADSGNRYEVFARGADGGIDLRFVNDDPAGVTGVTVDVVQCKHMEGSTFAQLRASARREAKKLQSLTPQPTRYRFVTTKSLTVANKAKLRQDLSPWVKSDSDVLGAEDIEGLLNTHEGVERAHVKLWLSSAAQLDRVVNAATWARSQQMLFDLTVSLPRFVDTGVFDSANRRLYEEKALVLSGPPGIGKTSVARMLVADAVANGFEPVEISGDIDEAHAVVDSGAKQIFFYDDFLGATFLQDRLSKNEDRRLAAFMRRCRASKSTLFILTTREHILKQATSWYEELERMNLPFQRLLIELRSYSRRERALILYNHLYHSTSLTRSAKRSILRDDGFLKIIDHANYNPRIIEHATANIPQIDPSSDVLESTLGALDQPELIWDHAFRNQLDANSRKVVLLLSTMPSAITVGELEIAFEASDTHRGERSSPGTVRSALKVLDDSFTRSTQRHRREAEVAIANPSVADFAALWLRANPNEAVYLIDAATYFEQMNWFKAQLLRSDVDAVDVLSDAVKRAIMRTYRAAPLGWPAGPMTTGLYEAFRTARGAEARLLFAMGLRQSVPASEVDAEFDAWCTWVVEQSAERWSSGQTDDLQAALHLVTELYERGALTRELRSAVTRIALQATTRDQWDAVTSAILDTPGALDVALEDLVEPFANWIEMLLTSALEEVADADELAELEEIAERIGINTQDTLWQDAYDAIVNRPEQPETYSPTSLPGVVAHDADDDELRTIFERFRHTPDV